MSAARNSSTDGRPVKVPTGYAKVWPLYWDAGWRGVLPLPSGRKFPPPRGTTGYDAPLPSYADCWAWAEEHPRGNLALRMAPGQVGIDVDAYAVGAKVKRGDATIAEHARRAGVALPPTWRLTSRGADNPSGRYLFRTTPGVRLVTALTDVELLQPHHRYAVAWPSGNPHDDGRLVEWIDPSGRVASRVPSPDELPELPPEWLELLRENAERVAPVAVDAAEWRGWFAGLEPGPACLAVRLRLDEAENGARGRGGMARYEATRTGVLALLRLGERGHLGVVDALRRLRAVYVAAVADRADEHTARAEFARFHRPEAIGLLLATPTPEDRRACICPEGIARLLDSIDDPDLRAHAAATLGVSA